jgi:hypothetical protein
MAENFGIVSVLTGVSAGTSGYLQSFTPADAAAINEPLLDESGNVIKRHYGQHHFTATARLMFVSAPTLPPGTQIAVTSCPDTAYNITWTVIGKSFNEDVGKWSEFSINLEADADLDVDVDTNIGATPTPSPTPTPTP